MNKLHYILAISDYYKYLYNYTFTYIYMNIYIKYEMSVCDYYRLLIQRGDD